MPVRSVFIEPLFEQAIHKPTLLNVAAARQGECCILSSMEALGVQRLAIAPLFDASQQSERAVRGQGPERCSQDHEVLLLTLAEPHRYQYRESSLTKGVRNEQVANHRGSGG